MASQHDHHVEAFVLLSRIAILVWSWAFSHDLSWEIMKRSKLDEGERRENNSSCPTKKICETDNGCIVHRVHTVLYCRCSRVVHFLLHLSATTACRESGGHPNTSSIRGSAPSSCLVVSSLIEDFTAGPHHWKQVASLYFGCRCTRPCPIISICFSSGLQ